MSDPLEAYRQTLRRLLDDRAGLEAKLLRIETAIEAVAEYIPESERARILGSLDADSEAGETSLEPEVSRFPPNTTIAEAAETVLRAMGRPMKARELVRMLRAWHFPYRKDDVAFHASLGGVLARKAGAGEVFSKLEPGTFGLLDWEAEDQKEAEAASAEAVTEEAAEVDDELVEEEVEPSGDFDPRFVGAMVGRPHYDDFEPPPFDDEDDDLPF